METFGLPPPRPVRIILTGPPASGKGTQSAMLAQEFKLVHISTGDMLRAAVVSGTELGLQARRYMDQGELVPDELVIALLQERMAQPDVIERGWVLDGFPRTIAQVESLDAAGVQPDLVLCLEVPEAELVQRVTGRRSDPVTGRVYHLQYDPPPADDAELLQRLVQRSDDSEETLRTRLDAYQQNVAQLKGRYAEVLAEVDGHRSKQEVFADLTRAVGMVHMHRQMVAQRAGPPKVILLGPPGAGKSTQARLVAERTGGVYLRLEDVIREAAAQDTRSGRLIRHHLENNELLPNHLVVECVARRLSQPDVQQRGWVIGDMPRTLMEVSALQEAGIVPHLVVVLELPHEMLEERMQARRIDPQTGRAYNLITDPPPADDAELQARLVHHPADQQDGVRRTLGTYYLAELELESLYAGKLVRVDSTGAPEETSKRVLRAVQGRGLPLLSDLARSTYAERAIHHLFPPRRPRYAAERHMDILRAGEGSVADLRLQPVLVLGDCAVFMLCAWLWRVVFSPVRCFDAIAFKTALPFVVVWLMYAPYWGAYMVSSRENLRAILRYTPRPWLICLLVALAVRSAVMNQTPSREFVLLAAASTLLLLMAWRAVYMAWVGPYSDKTDLQQPGIAEHLRRLPERLG